MGEDSTSIEEQRRHFEIAKHQYPVEAILHPPRHTALEIRGVLDALRSLPTGASVLDFGAGTGRLTFTLARQGYQVLAVDVSEASLAALEGLAARLGVNGIRTATALPGQGVFAAIVGADVLHHVDLDSVLPRFRSLLDGDGQLVFTEPGGMNPAWYAYLTLAYDMRVERRIVHSNLRTLHRSLDRAGFRDIHLTGVGVLPRPLFGWSDRACRIHDRAGNLPVLRWLAYRYLIEARAPHLP